MSRRRSRSRFLIPLAALALLVALPACSPTPPVVVAPAGVVIPVPSELTAALAEYRAAGPKGWAFTQTSTGPKKNLVERFDPRLRGEARWTLLTTEGRAPTDEERLDYRRTSAAKAESDTASSVRDQLNLATCTLFASDERTSTYHFAVNPASKEDTAAQHMRAAFTLDRPSGVIVRVELFNFQPFSPVLSLNIDEARTIMVYTVPTDGRPSLLSEITMKLRGRRLWVRSFSQDMSVRFTDYENASATSAPSAPPQS